MQIVSVNGKAYTAQVLRDAITEAERTKQPLELQFRRGDHLRGLRLKGRRHGAAQAEQPRGQPLGPAQQALYRGEVEAVRLQVLDQPQPGDVLGAVVADTRPHLRRRSPQAPQETAIF